MKTISLPYLDPANIYTPVLLAHEGKFAAVRDPNDSQKIILSFDNDADADAMGADLHAVDSTVTVSGDADKPVAPAAEDEQG